MIAYHTNIIKSKNKIISVNKCKARCATAVILLRIIKAQGYSH